MAQVTIKINGFTYSVGCEDGQEHHLIAMAEQVDQRVQSIKALGSQSGEGRLLVLAALLMADELHDLVIETNGLRTMRSTPSPAPAAIPAPMPAPEPVMAPGPKFVEQLAHLAARAEEIAAQLENS